MSEPDKIEPNLTAVRLIVCELRYEGGTSVNDGQIFLAIHRELGGYDGPYPKAQKHQIPASNMVVGEGGVQESAATSQRAWRLLSEDDRWVVTFAPESFSLQATGDTAWEGLFRDRLASVIDAVTKHITPVMEQRLGLRCVVQMTASSLGAPHEWRRYVSPELLGLALHEQLGPTLVALEQLTTSDAGNGARCTIRGGFFPDPVHDNIPTYRLDIDVHREGLRGFDPAGIKASGLQFVVLDRHTPGCMY